MDFKKVRDASDRTSPRVLSARLMQAQRVEPQYFGHSIDRDGTVMKQPTDMFGSVIGPKQLPDDRESPRWPRPFQPPSRPSSSGDKRSSRQGRKFRSQDAAGVRPPAAQQRAEHQVAPSNQVHDDPQAPKKSLTLDYVAPAFTVQRKDADLKLDLSTVDPSPRFRDPTFRTGRSHHKPVEPIKIGPRMNVQANPHGILPPNTSRHEQRRKIDKVYTCRQQFELRDKRQGENKEDSEHNDVSADEDEEEKVEQQPPEYRIGPEEEVIQPGTYKDFSGKVWKPDPENSSRRVVKEMIRDKIRWCRYQPDGRGNYVLRPEPEKLTIAQDSRMQHKHQYVQLNKTAFKQPKVSRKEEAIRKAKEREMEVARRKEEMEVDLKEWQEGLTVKIEEAKTRQRRASVFAPDLREIQATWLKYCVQAKAFSVLFSSVEQILSERDARMRAYRAAINIQTWVRGKVFLQRMIKQKKLLEELREAIRPAAYFLLKNWRAKQRRKKADILRIALQEHMQTNRVKRSISEFMYNVKRLQGAWKNYLKRERARMTLLSRQWERAFTYIRTKGKAGRLGRPVLTARAQRELLNNSLGGAATTPLRKGQHLSAPIPDAADAYIQQHNAQYITIPQKQVGLLSRLPQYPALKWVSLHQELRRMRGEHLQQVHQYHIEMADHTAFMEQKGVVETVLVGFAEDEESAHVLTEKLLGDMERGLVPEAPRLHPVLPPRKIQELILLAVQSIMADFNRQFFEDDGDEGKADKPKTTSPSRGKPWWILHECYSKVSVGAARYTSPFRATSPDFQAPRIMRNRNKSPGGSTSPTSPLDGKSPPR